MPRASSTSTNVKTSAIYILKLDSQMSFPKINSKAEKNLILQTTYLRSTVERNNSWTSFISPVVGALENNDLLAVSIRSIFLLLPSSTICCSSSVVTLRGWTTAALCSAASCHGNCYSVAPLWTCRFLRLFTNVNVYNKLWLLGWREYESREQLF